ncbi:MAG: DUF1415 family protein [Bacteriovoracaceae bacterium]
MIKKWLEKTIIGLDLCPFANKPYFEGKILIEELSGKNASEAQICFLDSLSSFQGQTHFETVLLVYPNWKINFSHFYEFLEDCENHLEALGLEDEFQLVVFHPDFCFEGLENSNRANLVNSSPQPLIHILKVQDLELLNLSLKDAEGMSFGNAKKLEELNEEELLAHFPWRK